MLKWALNGGSAFAMMYSDQVTDSIPKRCGGERLALRTLTPVLFLLNYSKSCHNLLKCTTQTQHIMIKTKRRFLSTGGVVMTAREEMERLLAILTPEELKTALRLFQEYSLKKQATQQSLFQKDLLEEQIAPA